MNITKGFPYLPPDLSTHGYRIDDTIFWLHVLMGLLFVGWGIFFIVTLWRFRSGRSRRANYGGVKSHISSYLEVTVAVVEGIFLVFLAIPLWSDRVDAMPVEENALIVRVVGQQFAWNVHYPGPDGKFGPTYADRIDVATGNYLGIDWSHEDAKDDLLLQNQLVVPKLKPVIVHVSALDVIHSFYLPELRVKQDAIPGMSVPVWFEAVATSKEYKEYRFEEAQRNGWELTHVEGGETKTVESPEQVRDLQIGCAQLCGVGHASMVGQLQILEPEDFEYWLKQTDEQMFRD